MKPFQHDTWLNFKGTNTYPVLVFVAAVAVVILAVGWFW